MMAPRLTPYLSRLSTLVNGIQSRSVHGIAPLTSAVTDMNLEKEERHAEKEKKKRLREWKNGKNCKS
ncbi:hypothetical protein Pcinc_000980 [Petrolisthes cinctipes]|uniref:Uncharacterized protein n=1 Tax=Petrolisthes cinctipes TaxID=88211 RepID=A0AAE1KJZ2_PETCI|nr:hypothetical protein Pcinc_033311 [Petrolisthes cinctipes]KAK3868966.1 hypothetical protein Pcinc_025690 [Petrolisthes cinctipes]KAK3874793.1 hypothetical protein Pcinc_020303 [Petrolisthes cinctipes]KAK3875775.1 hypothetical protein Pcinc_019372 [Petrolisthes cinctipes]KAK3895309.1 hypothetical protein Pcinc_000980 [Petrolisthes cinctipes]